VPRFAQDFEDFVPGLKDFRAGFGDSLAEALNFLFDFFAV